MNIKKLFAVATVVSFSLVGLAGCGEEKASSDTSAETSSESTTSDSTVSAADSSDIVIDGVLQTFIDAPDKEMPSSLYLLMDDLTDDGYVRAISEELKAPFGPAEFEAVGYTFGLNETSNTAIDCENAVGAAGLSEYLAEEEGRTELTACNGNLTTNVFVAGENPNEQWAMMPDNELHGFQVLATPDDAANIGVRGEVDHNVRFEQGYKYFVDLMGKPDELYVFQEDIGGTYMQFAHSVYKADTHNIITSMMYSFDPETKEIADFGSDIYFMVGTASPEGYSSILFYDQQGPEPFTEDSSVPYTRVL